MQWAQAHPHAFYTAVNCKHWWVSTPGIPVQSCVQVHQTHQDARNNDNQGDGGQGDPHGQAFRAADGGCSVTGRLSGSFSAPGRPWRGPSYLSSPPVRPVTTNQVVERKLQIAADLEGQTNKHHTIKVQSVPQGRRFKVVILRSHRQLLSSAVTRRKHRHPPHIKALNISRGRTSTLCLIPADPCLRKSQTAHQNNPKHSRYRSQRVLAMKFSK